MSNRSPRSSPPSARKESSFLQKIGEELSTLGLSSSRSKPSSASATNSSNNSSNVSTPTTSERRSHRPAPRVPGGNASFPGVKLRSRESLLPPAATSSSGTATPDSDHDSELDDDDFKALAGLLDNKVESVIEASKIQDDDEDDNENGNEATVLISAPPKLSAPAIPTRTRAELEKDLARMSISDLVPQEEAPAPPAKKSPRAIIEADALANEKIAALEAAVEAASEANAVLKGDNERLHQSVARVEVELDRSRLKEKQVAANLSQREREHRIASVETKQRVQELEIQLDVLNRRMVEQQQQAQESASAPPKVSEEPPREELLAAMDAYRKKLAELDEAMALTQGDLEDTRRKLDEAETAVVKSDTRKTQLRDDLRNLIAKSKEIERNAKQWKERCESYEAKFAKTKGLAREFSERCKALEREKKASASADEVEELKLKVVKLEQRSQKAEEMVKVSVGVIKRSGSSDLKKELSLALQSLQHQSKLTLSPSVSSSSSTVEVKAERRKSPRNEEGRKMLNRSDTAAPKTFSKPSISVVDSDASGEKKSPRLLGAAQSSSTKAFMSPQIERKKQSKFVTASAGGSKTPTVVRKKDSLDVSKTPTVTASPQMRKKNPARIDRSLRNSPAPSPQVRRNKSIPRDDDSAFDLLDQILKKTDKGDDSVVEEDTQNPFDMLEDVLSGVEKETGAMGLTGNVDNSSVFEAGSTDSASDYLASMTHAAQAESQEQSARERQRVESESSEKAEQVWAAAEQKRQAHRDVLSKFLAEEQSYMEKMLRDPTNSLHPLLPILSKEKVLNAAEKTALLDAAKDADFVGSEFVVRVQLFDARDLSDPSTQEIFGVVSVKSDQQKTKRVSLTSNVQWNESFLFSGIDANSRVTITIMSKKTRLGVAQVNLSELSGCAKEYYPIVDNSNGQDSMIRGMLTASVSLHTRTVRKDPLVVTLDPNCKDYQDAVRYGVQKLKRCEENKPREREFDATVKLSPVHIEMDKAKPNLTWIAQQLRAGSIAGDDAFENVYRRTVLHLMCILGDIEMVEKCLAAGADPKKRDCFGMYPFHLAIVWDHLRLLQNLQPVMRAFGQSVHTPENSTGLPPVHMAAVFNRPRILAWLLEQGADADDKDDFAGLPLHKAAYVGSLQCVRLLVEKRAFVKAEDIDGNTALLLAMMEGHWDVADFLLTNNVTRATWDTVNLAGENCLLFAVQRSNKRFTSMFLESREASRALKESCGPYKWSILMRALLELEADEGENVIRLLVDAMVQSGIDLNHRSLDGKTAAFIATFRGHQKLLEVMASRGLDVLAEDENQNSCLHFSSSLSVVEVLLKAGANVNCKNKQGNTPLHAAYCFHPESVDMLISHGASANAKNMQGRKPVECVGIEGSICSIPYGASGKEPSHRGTAGIFIP